MCLMDNFFKDNFLSHPTNNIFKYIIWKGYNHVTNTLQYFLFFFSDFIIRTRCGRWDREDSQERIYLKLNPRRKVACKNKRAKLPTFVDSFKNYSCINFLNLSIETLRKTRFMGFNIIVGYWGKIGKVWLKKNSGWYKHIEEKQYRDFNEILVLWALQVKWVLESP